MGIYITDDYWQQFDRQWLPNKEILEILRRAYPFLPDINNIINQANSGIRIWSKVG